jgi:tetratricopeptide (TPR) repeat protein
VLDALQAIVDHRKTKPVGKAVEGRITGLLQARGVTSEAAFDFYKKLREREPDNVVALRGLGGIYLSRGEHDEARDALEALAEHARDGRTRAEASTELGRLVIETGGERGDAVQRFEEAIGHDGTYQPALTELRRLHTEAEDWQSLVGVVAREASMAEEADRLPAFVEIATLWQDRLGNEKVARSSWQKVLQIDPSHAEAIERLLDLLGKDGEWADWLDVADRQLPQLSGLELRDRRAELGQVAHDKAGQSDRAMEYLRAAVDVDQPSPLALRTLRSMAREKLDWERFISLSEQLAECTDEDEERVSLYEEAGAVRLDQLLDRDGAAALYRKALVADPSCQAAQAFFVNYYFDTEAWEEALPVFKSHEAVVDQLDIDEDDDDRIEATAYNYKFGIVLTHTGDEAAALARFTRALALTPTHLPSLEAAAPMYFEAQNWKQARETSRAILRLRGGTGEAGALTELYLRLGGAEVELGDAKNALKRFKKALDLSANDVRALQGIARIHRDAEDWNSLLSTYNSIIKYARDPDEVILAYTTKGDVLEQKLEFTDKAVLHYEKVLMYDKQNLSAMNRLAEISLRRGDAERAREFIGRSVQVAVSAEERIQAALLSQMLASGQTVDVTAMVELVRTDIGTSDDLEAFASAVTGEAPLADVALAFRDQFCRLAGAPQTPWIRRP